ncbi:MAG: PadR family transcriptional regulator [Vicinamibacterales bacterium]
MKRGLSFGTVAILHAIADGKRFGFDIMAATGLTSGTVYPALDRLEDQRFVKSAWEDARVAHREGRPPRRYFQLTPAGGEVLAEALQKYKTLRPVTIGVAGKGRR